MTFEVCVVLFDIYDSLRTFYNYLSGNIRDRVGERSFESIEGNIPDQEHPKIRKIKIKANQRRMT
jgi:hypothetical protein